MAIEFVREVETASFYSPLEDFASVDVEVEIREDPLTSRMARIVPGSFVRPEGEPNIDAVVEDAEGCFFCPDRVGEVTPKYPDWVGMDRGHVGEATSFPNLNPYGQYSNVVALTEAHYEPIDTLTNQQFTDGLVAALAYVDAVFEHDAEAMVGSVNMNFLRAAGSSIIHPHLQTLVDDRGTNEANRRAAAAREFLADTGRNYWSTLAEVERGGDRYVGSTGAVEWVAPFAPKHHYQVTGIVDGLDVLGPDDDVVADVADGIVRVLASYAEAGLNSFNFALHLFADEPACPPVIELVGRSVFDQYYWSDSPFFVTLHDEAVVDQPPEAVAAATAEHF